MEFTVKQTNPGETVLILSGQLDFMVRKEFQAALQAAQAQNEIQHIILDLTNVSFIDCSAIGILIKAKQELSEEKIMLSLQTTSGRVFDVIQTLGLDKMFSMVPSH